MKIDLPIVLAESDEIFLYESVDYAILDLETIDVSNESYSGYDSIGRVLCIECKNQSIRIYAAEDLPTHQKDLRHLLIKAILALSCGIDDHIAKAVLENLPLSQLIERCKPYSNPNPAPSKPKKNHGGKKSKT